MSHKCLFVTVFTSEPSCVILENALMACARKPKVSKTMIKTRRHTRTMMTKMEMLVCGEDVGDVDEEEVGDVYDYILMSLSLHSHFCHADNFADADADDVSVEDVGDVDEEGVGDVYDYVLMSLLTSQSFLSRGQFC